VSENVRGEVEKNPLLEIEATMDFDFDGQNNLISPFEQLAEGRGDILAGLRGKVGGDLAQEMGGAVGGIDLAAHVQGDPFRTRRNHPDIVLPCIAIQRLLHQIGQRAWGQRPVEIAESALPDGRQDALGVAFTGQDDPGGGADGTNAPQQGQAVEAVVPLSGQDEIDRAGTQQVDRFAAAGHVPDLTVVAFQETGQVSVDHGVGLDDQKAAGIQNISTL
jgi:hypothetical protein